MQVAQIWSEPIEEDRVMLQGMHIFTGATPAIHMMFYVPHEFSCFLLRHTRRYVWKYAEVHVFLRGSTERHTRRYGTPYAEVQAPERLFLGPIVDLFLRGSTVQPLMTICGPAFLVFSGRQRTVGRTGCVFPTRKYGDIAPNRRSMSLRGGTVERRPSLFLEPAG